MWEYYERKNILLNDYKMYKEHAEQLILVRSKFKLCFRLEGQKIYFKCFP